MQSFVNWLLSENFTDDEMSVANKTARAAGSIGASAIVPRHVEKVEAEHDQIGKRHILDFGSGDKASHTQRLRDKGHNVTAHEFGTNQKQGVHDPAALEKKRHYDHTFASNVLNVQGNKKMMGHTLDQIHSVTQPNGSFTGNFPASPRKAADIDSAYVENELKKRFHHVERVKGMGTKQAPLFHAKQPKQDYNPNHDVNEETPIGTKSTKAPAWMKKRYPKEEGRYSSNIYFQPGREKAPGSYHVTKDGSGLHAWQASHGALIHGTAPTFKELHKKMSLVHKYDEQW